MFTKNHHRFLIIRFDDSSAERSKGAFVQVIDADLARLGVEPDRVSRQSQYVTLFVPTNPEPIGPDAAPHS